MPHRTTPEKIEDPQTARYMLNTEGGRQGKKEVPSSTNSGSRWIIMWDYPQRLGAACFEMNGTALGK